MMTAETKKLKSTRLGAKAYTTIDSSCDTDGQISKMYAYMNLYGKTIDVKLTVG